MPAEPAYLTVREVQTRLRLGKPDAVLAAIRSGRLAALNVSSGSGRPTWRIAEPDLAAWLASLKSQPPTKPTRRPKRARLAGVREYF